MKGRSMTRRLRRIGFIEDWLVACFQSMNNWPNLIQLPKWDCSIIPADAKVESVRWEPDHRCWVAVLSHESFAEIPNHGDELPSSFYLPSPEMVLIARQPDGSFREDRGQPTELPIQKIITDARCTYKSLSVDGLKELGRGVADELRLRNASQILFDVGCSFCGDGGEQCPVRCLPGIPVSIAYCDECTDKARVFAQEMRRSHWDTKQPKEKGS